MDWYLPTINAGEGAGNKGKRGYNETDEKLRGRYDETWTNLVLDPYDLYKEETIGADELMELEKWFDLKGVASGSDASIGVTLGWKPIEHSPDLTVLTPDAAGWTAEGIGSFLEGKGLEVVSHSPSYAFTTLHIPDYADSFYVEFLPEIWGPDDSYVLLFDDEILYWLDGIFFENEWMDTGFIDISRWAGMDVLFTIGLISDEPDHKVVTGGYGFFSREARSAAVPEPATLALLLLGIALLAYGRMRGARVR